MINNKLCTEIFVTIYGKEKNKLKRYYCDDKLINYVRKYL